MLRKQILRVLLSWISFAKTSRSFHNVSTHFCFCNFGTTLPLRPTEIRWDTHYSFPSCKNIHRMFLLRQSLIGKKRKNNGYEIVSINNTLALFNNKTLKRVQGDGFCHPEFISGSCYSQKFANTLKTDSSVFQTSE